MRRTKFRNKALSLPTPEYPNGPITIISICMRIQRNRIRRKSNTELNSSQSLLSCHPKKKVTASGSNPGAPKKRWSSLLGGYPTEPGTGNIRPTIEPFRPCRPFYPRMRGSGFYKSRTGRVGIYVDCAAPSTKSLSTHISLILIPSSYLMLI